MTSTARSDTAGQQPQPVASDPVADIAAFLAQLAATAAAPAPALMDASAASAYVAVSRRFLREASLAGEVAYSDLRGRGKGSRDLMRWAREDLDDWVARCRVPATSAGAILNTVTPAEPRTYKRAPAVAPRATGTRGKAAPVLSARDAIRKKAAA